MAGKAVGKKVAASAVEVSAGANPYDERLFKRPKFHNAPRCMYFYYVGRWDNALRKRPVKHYYYTNGNQRIKLGDLDQIVATLIANARNPSPYGNPPQHGSDWNYLVWTRKSYVVIFIDDPLVQSIPGQDVLVFDNNYGGTDNYSFFDARETTIGGCLTIWCINHMKKPNQNGDDLEVENQRLHFKLITNPPLNVPRGFYPDSGGTNMGPPVPPP